MSGWALWLATSIAPFLWAGLSHAGSLATPLPGYDNVYGLALSAGWVEDRDASFYGASTDYTRMLTSKWLLNVSMAWDRERSTQSDQSTKVVNTLTPAVAAGYVFTRRIAAGLALGKGILDDDNATGKLEFSNGDLSLGAIGAFTYYQTKRHALDVTVSVDRNLTEKETSVSLDLGWGFAF